MANQSAPLSYSAALGGQSDAPPPKPAPSQAPPQPRQQQQPSHHSLRHSQPRPKRSPSPSHRPRQQSPDEPVYVLTILTSKAHHDRMTRLRNHYFPKHINKLEAHLTLFHALPESKLQSTIVPTLHDVASTTERYKVRARKVMRLKKGVAIGVTKDQGGLQTQEVHKRLKEAWLKEGGSGKESWLSEQDRGGCHVHYTVMNKVDDEETVQKAVKELETFQDDVGWAEGLSLYKYDRGFWRWQRNFEFAKQDSGQEDAR